MAAKDFLINVPIGTDAGKLSTLCNLDLRTRRVMIQSRFYLSDDVTPNPGTVWVGGSILQPVELMAGDSVDRFEAISDIYVKGSQANMQIAVTAYWS